MVDVCIVTSCVVSRIHLIETVAHTDERVGGTMVMAVAIPLLRYVQFSTVCMLC